MSDNRSTSTATRKPSLADFYNDFFKYLSDLILPVLPEKIKNDPLASSYLNDLSTYCNDDKKFVFLHYGVCKKVCDDPNSRQAISNLTDLVQDNEESREKLRISVVEIKKAAEHLMNICKSITESPDHEVQDKIEMICLYIDLITKQFMGNK